VLYTCLTFVSARLARNWLLAALGAAVLIGAPTGAQAAVGRTPGSFAVTDTGTASYSIPIMVPPGANGLQPALAISYDSRSDNGPLGIGWSLSGFSIIQRCQKTLAQDSSADQLGFQAADRYCMDGKKLRLTGGTYGAAGSTYQTEVDQFMRVTAIGSSGKGPDHFSVQDRNGLTYLYGSTSGSRDDPQTPSMWAVDRITDRAGNYITIQWTGGSSSSTLENWMLPVAIRYANNDAAGVGASSEVDMIYETRPSNDYLTSTRRNGFQTLRTMSRLEEIDVYEGTLVKVYKLTYNTTGPSHRSRLSSVQECDGSNVCLNATQIGWQDGQAGFGTNQIAANLGSLAGFALALDINGDGRTDVVYPSGTTWAYMLASPSGGYLSPVVTSTPHNGKYANALAVDYYANGTQELLVPDASGNWSLLQLSGSNLVSTTLHAGGAGGPTIPAVAQSWVGDVNGDGYPDLVYLSPNSTQLLGRFNSDQGFSSTVSTLYTVSSGTIYLYATTQSFNAQMTLNQGDFNGDGRTDLLIGVVQGTPRILMSTGSGYVDSGYVFSDSSSGGTSIVATTWRALDANGDGIDDVAFVDSSGTWKVLYGYPSSATGLFHTTVASTISSPATPGGTAVLPVDYDGDGRVDILAAFTTQGVTPGSNWLLLHATGDMFSTVQGGTGSFSGTAAVDTGVNTNQAATTLADVNGDGLLDMVYADTSNNWHMVLHNGPAPDLVNSITDGYGNYVHITYAPLTDSSVYTKGTGAVYPLQDLSIAFQVVKQATSSDGVGSSYDITESYAGARTDLSGRGFLGFSSRTETDSRNHVATQRTYRQDFPFVGLTAQISATQPNSGPVMAQTVNNWVPVTLDATANNQRYFASLGGVTRQIYEVGGTRNAQLVKTFTTTNSFDNFGNATQIIAKVTDNDSTSPYNGQSWTTTTTNTPDVDSTNWCLPLETQQQVVYTSTLSPAITRSKQFTPDTVKCRYTQTVTEPASTLYRVQEDLLYDAFGNVSTRTVTGINMTARVTKTDWGATGRLPMKVTDPAGLITQHTYNLAFATPASTTDPNNLTTSWQYDTFGRKTQETRPDGTATTYNLSDCAPLNTCDSHTRTVLQFADLDSTGTRIRAGNNLKDSFGRPTQIWSKTLNTPSATYSSMVETDYDALGRVVGQSMPVLTGSQIYFETRSYDLLNRISQASRPTSSGNATAALTKYDYAGDTSTITDTNNHVKTLITDPNGWLRQTQDHTGYAITFGYDSAGSKTSVTDSLGNTLASNTYVYGIDAFRLTSVDADLGSWSYTPDALGEQVAWSDARHQQFSARYDLDSRMTDRNEPDLYTHWTWGTILANHEIGQLSSVCTGTSTNPTVCSASGYAESKTYDQFARAASRVITLPGEPAAYTYSWTYSATTGFVDTLTYPADGHGYRLAVKFGYQYGLLQSITDVSDTPNVALWTGNADNERLQYTQETLGNGVVVNHVFDAVTGMPSSITAGVGGGAGLQNNSYLYDGVGNLIQRQDNVAGTTESVYPDPLNRLDHTVGDTNTALTFDTMGRLSTWQASGAPVNVNDYTTAQPGCTYYANSQPHALRKGVQGTHWAVTCYDANGNAVQQTDNYFANDLTSFSWTSYNQPLLMSNNALSSSSQFSYDHNHQRWKQVASYSGAPETTVYVAELLEKMTNASGTTYRYYVPAGNNTVVYLRPNTGTNAIYYLTRDNLGSTAAVMNQAGALVAREKFAALGWNNSTAADRATMANITRHEYTGHEGIDNNGLWLVNMNGRVYIPSGTVFVSPDPNIPDPTSTTSYNRYGYVNYNPLTLTDPTGYFSLGDLLNPFSNDNPLNPFGHVGRSLALLPFQRPETVLRKNKWLQPIAEAAACYWGGPWGCAGASAALTRINGGSVMQSLEAGFVTFGTYGAVPDTGHWYTDALVNGYMAGATAGVLGGDVVKGFEFGVAGSVAMSGYTYFTGGAGPDLGPGEDRTPTIGQGSCGQPGASCYWPDAGGHVPVDFQQVNLFGLDNGSTGCFAQSELCSRIFDKVPGLQAVALVHDNWMWHLVDPLNYPTMLPAAALTYAAFAGQYSGPLMAAHPYYNPRDYDH
jgi:RHS repeat-associated protein